MNPEWKAYGIYAGVALAVLLPLFWPGFILTLDLVFTPTLPMPSSVTSSYPFHALLHVLNILIPAEIIQKFILLTILLLASIGMHRLIRTIDRKRSDIDWGIYIASIFFAINPFTYSRFMAGQYAVLLGYALLPWFARALLKFAAKPTALGACKLGGLAALIGIVSIHTLAALAILTVAYSVAMFFDKKQRRKFFSYGLLGIGLFFFVSSYWIVPLAMGQGKTAATIADFTSADTSAFATAGGNPLERIYNMLHLQGFWAEGRGLYLLPQDRMILWGLLAILIGALVIVGAVNLWRKRRLLVLWLGSSALIAICIAAGTWTTNIPLLTGLREPHKLIALVALGYGVFLAFGINAVLGRLYTKNQTLYAATAVLFVLLPFIYMRVMFFGFDGQLTPRQYPPDWTTANKQLMNYPNGQVLFLPWHQYMTFQFAGRIIANPAPMFFGQRTIVSNDPELGNASGGAGSQSQQAIANILPDAAKRTDLAVRLAGQDVRLILVAKELDYSQYDYLDSQPGITRVHDYPSIRLYKNEAWRQQ